MPSGGAAAPDPTEAFGGIRERAAACLCGPGRQPRARLYPAHNQHTVLPARRRMALISHVRLPGPARHALGGRKIIRKGQTNNV